MTSKFLIIKLKNQKQEAHLYCQGLTSLPQSCVRPEWDQLINLYDDASGCWNFPQLQINSNEKESWSKFFWNTQSSRLLQMKNSADEFRVWVNSNHIQSALNKVELGYCPGTGWILPHPWKVRSTILGWKSEYRTSKGFSTEGLKWGQTKLFCSSTVGFQLCEVILYRLYFVLLNSCSLILTKYPTTMIQVIPLQPRWEMNPGCFTCSDMGPSPLCSIPSFPVKPEAPKALKDTVGNIQIFFSCAVIQMKSNEIPNKLFPFFLHQILWSLQSFNVLNHSNPPLQLDAQFCLLGITEKVNPLQPCLQLQTFLLQNQLPKLGLLKKAPAQSPTPTRAHSVLSAAPPCLQKWRITGTFQALFRQCQAQNKILPHFY